MNSYIYIQISMKWSNFQIPIKSVFFFLFPSDLPTLYMTAHKF